MPIDSIMLIAMNITNRVGLEMELVCVFPLQTQKQIQWRLGHEASASRCFIHWVCGAWCGVSWDSPFAL